MLFFPNYYKISAVMKNVTVMKIAIACFIVNILFPKGWQLLRIVGQIFLAWIECIL